MDNEIDKKYLIESNNEFKTLPASEEIFQNQIQVLNTEITAKKFKKQEAEFRLKGTKRPISNGALHLISYTGI